jgi:hypothetical protein
MPASSLWGSGNLDGWTFATWKIYQDERDRRYTEVNIEKEKALKIKETADLAALGLAREIQTYKDEKANQLREQIGSERNLYVTKEGLDSAIAKLAAESTTDKRDSSVRNFSIFGAILVVVQIVLHFLPAAK